MYLNTRCLKQNRLHQFHLVGTDSCVSEKFDLDTNARQGLQPSKLVVGGSIPSSGIRRLGSSSVEHVNDSPSFVVSNSNFSGEL